MLQTWQSDLSQSQKERNKEMGEKKLTVTQGGTQTCDLANDLPCSNQLSYWVTWQLSGQIRVLNAELPGIQPKQISSWYIQWGGCSEREAQGAWHSDINMLQTWQSDLSLSQSYSISLFQGMVRLCRGLVKIQLHKNANCKGMLQLPFQCPSHWCLIILSRKMVSGLQDTL